MVCFNFISFIVLFENFSYNEMKQIINIFFILIITIVEAEETEVIVEFEREKNDSLCSQIGIEDNAILNECGFCTKGDTGLEANYGFDCNNVCDGDSYLDCNNVCNGNSYIDQCTGICINPLKDEILVNEDKRDCRGLCLTSNINSNQYELDECGYCLLKEFPKVPNNCSLKCGPNDFTNTYICDVCIEGENNTTISQVLNACGKCRNNDMSGCSCDTNPSLCDCNDADNCYYISEIRPKAVPKNTEIKIQAFGYFNKPIDDLHCKLSDPIEGTVSLFSITIKNNIIIECVVNLTEVGQYVFDIESITSNISLKFAEKSNLILVYDINSVIYSNMNPTHVFTTNYMNSINLTFDCEANQTIQQISLQCIIIYNDMRQLVINGNNHLTCTIPPSVSHSISQNITIIPTFDEIHSLSNQTNFTLTIFSPFPQIHQNKSFISKDGLNILIFFERQVNVFISAKMQSQESCDYLLTNTTLSELRKYKLMYCKWLTKVQLLISLGLPIDQQFIKISINERTLKESEQQIALHNMKDLEVIINKQSSDANNSYETRIELIGPTLMPLCGTFTLNGYFYSSKGSKGVKFKWSINSLPPRYDLISDKLLKIIDSCDKSSLLLESEIFSLEPYSYRFILRAELPEGQVIEASHQIFKYNYHLPIVTIFPTTLLASGSLSLDQSAILFTEVSIPECIDNPEPLIYIWKTNNPKVKFNFSNIHSPNYYITKLNPVNQRIKFEVHVSMISQTTHPSIASITLYSSIPDKIAVISNDISSMSIGRESGKFYLFANVFKLQTNHLISYQWSCHYIVSQQPCVLYSNNKKLLVSKNIQNKPHLTLDSDMLRVAEHNFGLHVIVYKNATNHQLYSTYINVNVFNGKAPQVFISSVQFKDLLVSKSISQNVISVPSHTPLIIKGIVKNLESIESIEWLLSDTIFQLQWNNKFINNEIQTELHLHEDQIFPYGSYNLTLKACNPNGSCSQVNKHLIAGPVVTQCNVIVEPIMRLKMIRVTIDRCNIPPNRSPLTYQLYLMNDKIDKIDMPLSRPQFSSIINYFLPQMTKNATKFAVKVCDNYNYCQIFNESNDYVIEIDNNENSDQLLNNLINGSLRYSSSKDPISALTLLMSPLLNQSFLNNELIDSLVVEQFENISPKNFKSKGDLILIYYIFGEILKKSNNYNLKNKVIEVLKNITETTQLLPDIQTLDDLYTNLMNYNKFEKVFYDKLNSTHGYYRTVNETHIYLMKIRHIFQYIIRSTAQLIPIGKYVKLGDKLEFPEAVTLITHQKRFYELSLETRLNYWKNVTTNVKLNERAIHKYINETPKPFNLRHNSWVYAITLFPNSDLYEFDNKVHRLTPTVNIAIHSPLNGEELQVFTDKFDYIAIMRITLTGNQSFGGSDFATKCHYFDENKQKWDREGIIELGISGSSCGCLAFHLSSFVILRVPQPINTDYILGVIVAIMMGVLIFGIMVVFFVQKKNETPARVAPQSYRYRRN